jgi:hypothetical protein
VSNFPDVNALAGIAASQVKNPAKILKPVVGAILGGLKYDTDKTRYELLPPELMHAVADILTFGAKKYSDRNWELGMEWSRPFGALMRHMWAWWRGDGVDAETGKSHLWHAGCCLAFLIAYEQRGIGKDDRPN